MLSDQLQEANELLESAGPDFMKLRDLLRRAESAIKSDPIIAKDLLNKLAYEAKEESFEVDTDTATDALYAGAEGVQQTKNSLKHRHWAIVMKGGKFWAYSRGDHDDTVEFASYAKAKQKAKRATFTTKTQRSEWINAVAKKHGVKKKAINVR